MSQLITAHEQEQYGMHVCINKALISQFLPLLEWNQSNGKDRYSSYEISFIFFPLSISLELRQYSLEFLFDHASTGAKTSPGE